MTLRTPSLQESLQSLPDGVELANHLNRFAESLAAAAGANLVSLVVFGGVARGRWVRNRSDVNVAIVLERADEAALAAIAPAIAAAWSAAAVQPLILTRSQLATAARVFPTKLLDIKSFNIRLVGVDVFSGLTASPERVRWRIEQELHNLAIRLRRRCVAAMGNDAQLARELASIARPLAIELSWLLRVRGHEVPDEDRTVSIFEAASVHLGLSSSPLQDLGALRAEPSPRPGLASLCAQVIEVMLAAAALAAEDQPQS